MDKRGPAIFLSLTLVGVVLGALGVISIPLGHGISGFWVAGVVQVAGGIWFGGWGVLAAAFFPSVSNALTHSSLVSILGFIPANLVQSWIPAWAFRRFGMDPGIPGRRGIRFYLVWGTFASAVAGALLGAACIVLLGGAPIRSYPVLFAKWAASNMVVSILVGLPVQRELTPIWKDLGLLVKQGWAFDRRADRPGRWRLRDLPIQVKLFAAMCAGGFVPLLILSMLEFAKTGGRSVPGDLTPLFLIISLVTVVLGVGFLSRETVRPIRELQGQTEDLLNRRGGQIAVDRQDEIGKLGTAFDFLLGAVRREREAAERYLQVAQVILVAIDTRNRVTMLNRKGYSVLGYDEGELLGQDWYRTCVPPEEYATVTAVAARILAGDLAPVEMSENHILRKDGSRRLIAWHDTLLTDEAGRILGTLSSGEDITERRQAEQDREKSVLQLRILIDTIPDLVWLKDVDGVYLGCNRRFERFFGASEQDIVGRTDYDFVDRGTADFFRENDRRAMAAGKPTVNEEEITFAEDGHREFLETIKTPIIGSGGEIIGVIGIGRDITERQQAEQQRLQLQTQLQQSQKLESLGALAGGVAHDMNNVLGAILGLASAHLDSQPAGSPLHRALDTICKATERGGKMVKGLLSFARQSPVENLELDLNAILTEQVGLLERTTLAKVRLDLDLDPDLRPIRGDAGALNHALMNLYVNAVDAMPGNGTLSLHTRNVDDDWIEVVVEDTGTGMPREVLERAMDPFFTTKGVGKGTGLGLSMVFSTVKAHRGQMAIESEPDRGTRVRLRFPACQRQAPGAACAAVEEASPAPGTLEVLVVDDDDLIRSSIQELLGVLGHGTTLAPSGEEALVLLEAGYEPDLVILDMNMPGLGGAGTLPRLRGLRPELPVLLATGRVDQVAVTLAAAHPGVTLLSKPFGLRELRKQLESLGLE